LIGPDAFGLFLPEMIVQVKALVYELPATRGLLLSRLSIADVALALRCHPSVAASLLDLSARSRFPDPRTVSFGSPRVLDHGQRLLASRPSLRRSHH
jgi:hypothetical protein